MASRSRRKLLREARQLAFRSGVGRASRALAREALEFFSQAEQAWEKGQFELALCYERRAHEGVRRAHLLAYEHRISSLNRRLGVLNGGMVVHMPRGRMSQEGSWRYPA